jgi:hypothetical protein
MPRRLALRAAVFILFASPAVVEAAGTINGVSATPSPATAGHEVTISVTGSGSCQALVIFGDNQKSLVLTQLPAPSVKHVYAAPGSYVIRVISRPRMGNEPPGLSPCSGFADMALTVKASATRMAAPAVPPVKSSSGPSSVAPITKGYPTYEKIPVTPVEAKPARQDNWTVQGTTPTPTQTPTPKGGFQ